MQLNPFSIDSNPFENFFETTTPDQQQNGFWDSVIGAGQEIIGKLPDVVDGVIDNQLNNKETTAPNENIASKDPAVAGEANNPTKAPDNVGKYMLYGFGGLIALVVVAKVLK